MTSKEKDKISAKIRALMAKTTEAGCTEAEAIAAATKAKALMDEYHVSIGEAQLREEPCEQVTATKSASLINVKSKLAVRVASFCGVKAWKGSPRRGAPARVTFFGLGSDVDFASWLLDSLDSFIYKGANKFAHANAVRLPGAIRGNHHDLKKSFTVGAVDSINERLKTVPPAPTMSSGKSLVMVKDEIVKRAFQELGMNLRNANSSYLHVNGGDAYKAGKSAGDRASFNRPINTTSQGLIE